MTCRTFIFTLKKKKEPWAIGAEQPHWPFPDLVLGKDSEDPRVSFAGKSLEGRNHKLENPGPACRNPSMYSQ